MSSDFKPTKAELPPDLEKVLEGVQKETGIELYKGSVSYIIEAASANLPANIQQAVEVVLIKSGVGPETEGRKAYAEFAKRVIEHQRQGSTSPRVSAPPPSKKPRTVGNWLLR